MLFKTRGTTSADTCFNMFLVHLLHKYSYILPWREERSAISAHKYPFELTPGFIANTLHELKVHCLDITAVNVLFV